MAKILYGVAGEGLGHSSHAQEIISYLIKKEHQVKVVSYGKGYASLKPYFDTEEIFGLRLVLKKNEVQPLLTVLKNLWQTPKAVKSIKKVNRIIKSFKPQLIFSDFEPITAYMAKIKNIPLISIDNQHRLNKTKITYPPQYRKEALLAQAVIRLMMFRAKAYLITDFTKAKVIKKRTFIFPPILRKEVLKAKPKEKNFILVYLSMGFKELIPILQQIRMKFIVYGFDWDKKEKNITFKKTSKRGFLKDLANCRACLATAGPNLISEALYLGKPYLAIPVKGQFEQIFNAYNLQKLGYGKYWEDLDKEKIEFFLFNLDLYKKNLEKYKRNDNSKIFQKIDELIKKHS